MVIMLRRWRLSIFHSENSSMKSHPSKDQESRQSLNLPKRDSMPWWGGAILIMNLIIPIWSLLRKYTIMSGEWDIDRDSSVLAYMQMCDSHIIWIDTWATLWGSPWVIINNGDKETEGQCLNSLCFLSLFFFHVGVGFYHLGWLSVLSVLFWDSLLLEVIQKVNKEYWLLGLNFVSNYQGTN